jgi:hypothetical protein
LEAAETQAGTEVGRASNLPGFSMVNCHTFLIWLFGKLEACPKTASAASVGHGVKRHTPEDADAGLISQPSLRLAFGE